MTPETLAKLTQPFPLEAQKQKKIQGKTFTYVPHDLVIRRLLAATEGNYSFEIVSQHFLDWPDTAAGKKTQLHLVHGRIHFDGNFWDGNGVAIVYIGSGEDMFKAAESDAIKKAATKMGVALDLYGPDMEAELALDQTPLEENEHFATAKQINLIKGLFKTAGYTIPDEKGVLHHNAELLSKMMMSKYGRDLNHITTEQASETIDSLNSFIAGKTAKQE